MAVEKNATTRNRLLVIGMGLSLCIRFASDCYCIVLYRVFFYYAKHRCLAHFLARYRHV